MAGPEGSSVENPESNRDTLARDLQSPFALREPTEKSKEYPAVFMQSLTNNWEDVCTLMDWKKDGQAVNISTFNLAKDPMKVVQSIQAAIVAKGGKLDKYGQDGKFGSETETGLKQALAPAPTLSAAAPIEPAMEVPSRLGSVEDRAWQRLGEASLNVRSPNAKDFQARSRAFRETLGKQDPLLAKFVPYANELVQTVEVELEKISVEINALYKELSAFKAQEGSDERPFPTSIMDRGKALLADFTSTVHAKMASSLARLNSQLTPADKTALEKFKLREDYLPLDSSELALTFMLSVISELEIMGTFYVESSDELSHLVMDLVPFSDLHSINNPKPTAEEDQARAKEYEQILAEDALSDFVWQEAINHGPYTKPNEPLEFTHFLYIGDTHTRKPVNVKLYLDGRIQFGDRMVEFKASRFDKITEFKAAPNGRLHINGKINGEESGLLVHPFDLASFLRDIETGASDSVYQLNGLPKSQAI